VPAGCIQCLTFQALIATTSPFMGAVMRCKPDWPVPSRAQPGLLYLRLERLERGVRQLVIDSAISESLVACAPWRSKSSLRDFWRRRARTALSCLPLCLKIGQRRIGLGHLRSAEQRVYFRQ